MQNENNAQQLFSLMNILYLIGNEDANLIVGFKNKSDLITDRLSFVSRYIIMNFNRSISLDEVSRQLGMNRSSFCNFYKRETKETFFTSLKKYRINCAKKMLMETNKSVSEICYAVGFNDVPHFNRTFKEITNVKPSEFRGSGGVLYE